MQPHGWVGKLFGFSMDVLNGPAHRASVAKLSPQPGDSILEIGYGTGQLVAYLARATTHGLIAGVDPSELMVTTAQRRNAAGIASGRVDLRLGDAAQLPWPTQAFDKVVALHSFQFWADPRAAIDEIARVLKPGGLLLFVLRNHAGRKPSTWLPNPLSRQPDETAAAIRLLQTACFADAQQDEPFGSSLVIVAHKNGAAPH